MHTYIYIYLHIHIYTYTYTHIRTYIEGCDIGWKWEEPCSSCDLNKMTESPKIRPNLENKNDRKSKRPDEEANIVGLLYIYIFFMHVCIYEYIFIYECIH